MLRSVQIVANGKEVIHWKGNPTHLSMYQPLPNAEYFYLGNGHTSYRVTKFELSPLPPETSGSN
jgi:hypothetical protein